MHPRTDLSLLLEGLFQLSHTPYFNRQIEPHTRALIDTIQHVMTASPPYDDEIVRAFAEKAWTCHRYLQGSTTKESPYEIEFCLRHAISDWLEEPCLVTTSLTDEKDFHLRLGDPWHFVSTTLDRYPGTLPEGRLIFIGVPRLYKHMPLFCSALYHELGHFVDLTRNVVDTTMLTTPVLGVSDSVREIITSHRREYFSDLFASCYVGSAIIDSLNAVMPAGQLTHTHPPTADRIELIRAFLAGEETDEVSMFQDTLHRLGLPPLQIRFTTPSVEDAFDDLRPAVLSGERELHGIMQAGWSYLAKARDGHGPEWTRAAQPLEIVRVVNDLTEKSIRNVSVRQLWSKAAS